MEALTWVRMCSISIGQGLFWRRCEVVPGLLDLSICRHIAFWHGVVAVGSHSPSHALGVPLHKAAEDVHQTLQRLRSQVRHQRKLSQSP